MDSLRRCSSRSSTCPCSCIRLWSQVGPTFAWTGIANASCNHGWLLIDQLPFISIIALASLASGSRAKIHSQELIVVVIRQLKRCQILALIWLCCANYLIMVINAIDFSYVQVWLGLIRCVRVDSFSINETFLIHQFGCLFFLCFLLSSS